MSVGNILNYSDVAIPIIATGHSEYVQVHELACHIANHERQQLHFSTINRF